MTDEFTLKLVALLDKTKTKKQVNSDIRELEKVVKNLRLTATLAKGTSKQQINQMVKQLEGQLNKIKLQAKLDQKNLKSDVDKALQNISFKDIDIKVDGSKTKLKVQKALADVKKAVQNTPISVNVDLKKEKLSNDLTTYLSKNSKIRESEPLLKEADKLREKISGINDRDSLRNVTQEFQLFKSEVSATGYQSVSASDRIKDLLGNVTKIGSAFGLASTAISKYQQSLKTIKTNDSIITEINKTSNMTKAQLDELGNQSYDIASKYGRLSSDFLLGVQEMARSGYETASKGMAEVSLIAQAAGDMSADLANNYIIATDNAYKLNGEVSKLNAVLDGQNAISNSNSVAMSDMAEGMSKAGTVASSYRVSIEDLSAMIGTIESVTKSGGSEVGNAIKAILINLQNVTSDKMVDTLDAANASMTEMVNGAEKLRNPIDILRDLAKTFNQLDENDPLRAEILTNVGQKYHAAKLGALLQNMDMFDKMLVDYSNGAGSALREADLSANDLSGTLNRLSNSWDELVNSITNKSTIKGGVGFLDTLLQSATKLIDTVDVLPVALAGITAFMTAKNKDYGITKVFDTTAEGKLPHLDLEGNLFGIDFSQIKHFKEAEKAINNWNDRVVNGAKDIASFNNETVKNNASLREYLSTCTDGSASLKGYKQFLQAAGEATTSLRLGTILLNSALSLGVGLAIQGVITGLDYLIHKEEKEAEALEEAKNKFTQTTDEIKSLNDELSSTHDKIAELQKLADNGTISVADENELKLLKETNKELERKIALKQKEQIDDAKDLLKKVQKSNKAKPYSYAHYNDEGKYVTVRKHGDASEQLQDTIEQYQDAVKHYGKDKVNADNYNDTISEQAESVSNLLKAYQSLKDAGIELTKEQQAEYESALKAQDAYLLFSYNLNKTKEGFRALSEEQKRSNLNGKLLEQGLTEQEAKVVLKYIPEENLDDYYDFDFSFPLPDREDYKTAEEYGKAYAEAWEKGVRGVVQDESGGEDKPQSFKEAWKSLDNADGDQKDTKENLLELAKQGKLTVAEFNKTLGAKSWLKETALSAEEAVKKINNLKSVSSADQLSSMKTGISSISSALGEKKDNLGEKKTQKDGVGIDTLDSMPEDIKSCRKEYEKFCEVLGDGSSTMEECEEAADKLATAYVNNGNFLAKLTSKNEDYYISVLKEMGVQNAEQIVLDALNRKKAEATVQTMNFTNMTGEEIVKLLEEQGALNGTTEALKLYALKKIYANGNGLNTTDDINQLIALVKSLGYSTEAIDKYNEARNSAFKPTKNNQETGDIVNDILHGRKSVNSLIYDKNEYTEQQRENAAADIDSIIEKMENTKVAPPKVSVSPTGNPKDGDKGKSAKAKESRQEIDWLSRKLDTLQNKVDLLKTKFENLFSIGSKKNNLNQQIKQTEKLLKAQEKAASRYQKVADTYYKKNKKKLSKNGITLSMLQNGSYDVKSYKSGIAQIIQTYEDYYDKAQESKKATWELAAAIKDLSKQKLDLKLEDNERKRTYQEARYANATSAEAKRKILNKEINTYKSDDKAYAQYHKESKKQLKKDGNTAKAAVNKTKGLGKAAKDKIKKLIKQGKEIPSALMKKVKKHSTSAYQKLLEYNRGVDFVSDVLRDKKLAKEQNETNMREKRIERAQNYADEAEAKYNLNQQYETNAVSAKDKNKYEAESLKYLNKQYDKLIKIAELEGDVTEKKRLQAEKQEKVNESYQTMYDNIKAEYDNKTGLNDARISTIQSEIATLEAAGKSVSKSLYDGMMKLNEDTKEKLLKERAELEEAGKNFEYGSEEWYAWQNDLEVINQGLYDCTQNTIEWKKALNELDFKKFKLMAAQLDATKSHLDFLVDMLSHKDLTSKESGGLTDAGFATISLRFANMENNAKIRENAQAELAKLHEDHINGEDFRTEEEYLAYEKELEDTIRDTIAADADEKDAILDLVENAMQVQIDAIDELIEKKKKALATEKDYKKELYTSNFVIQFLF